MLLLRGECVSGVCVPVRYLPVQRALVTIKWIHYDEKFTVLFLQVFHVFALGMIIFYHFHDGYLLGKTKLIVSQEPEGSEWKFDDKLQILWEDGRGKTVSVPKRMVQKVLFLFFLYSWFTLLASRSAQSRENFPTETDMPVPGIPVVTTVLTGLPSFLSRNRSFKPTEASALGTWRGDEKRRRNSWEGATPPGPQIVIRGST